MYEVMAYQASDFGWNARQYNVHVDCSSVVYMVYGHERAMLNLRGCWRDPRLEAQHSSKLSSQHSQSVNNYGKSKALAPQRVVIESGAVCHGVPKSQFLGPRPE